MRSLLPIRSADLADAEWIAGFLRDRWNATTIVVHREVIEAANRRRLFDLDLTPNRKRSYAGGRSPELVG
jgi:hypothetical protein